MGETPAPLPSWRSPLLSQYPASVCTPRTPPLEPFPPSLPSSLLPLPGLPPLAFRDRPLPLCSWLGVRGSWTRRERVKAGAVPGRDGAEERGWDRRGGGAQARVGGPGRAPPEIERRAAAPGLAEAEAEPRGPHPSPGILAREKPGSPGGEEEVLGDPPPCADPAPGRLTRGAAGRCLGHHEIRDGSPLEVKPLSSRACAGRSRGQPRGPAASATHNFPAFHLGLAERPADLDAGLWAEGGPRPGPPVGAGGRAPRPQQLSDGAAG